NLERCVTIDLTGAPAGSVLYGAKAHNARFCIRTTEEQQPGCQGPIHGVFDIVDAGTNTHSAAVSGLVGSTTNADELLAVIRADSPNCVNMVNVNALSLHVPKRLWP